MQGCIGDVMVLGKLFEGFEGLVKFDLEIDCIMMCGLMVMICDFVV